ncbi:MAG: glycosyltransferase [Bacillota bacterium]
MSLTKIIALALFLLPLVRWEPAPSDLLLGLALLLFGTRWQGLFRRRSFWTLLVILLSGIVIAPAAALPTTVLPYAFKTAYIIFTGIVIASVAGEKLPELLKSLTLGAWVWGLVVLAGYLFNWSPVQYDPWRLMGFFKDPNVFGAFYAFIFLLALIQKQKHLLALSLFLVLASMSRGAWLGMVVGVLVIIGQLWKKDRTWLWQAVWTVGPTFVLAVSYFYYSDRLTYFLDRLGLQPYDTQRFAVQKSGLTVIAAREVQHNFLLSLFGHGHGTYELYHPISAHSLYVRTLFENGLVGLVFLLLVLGVLFRETWRQTDWQGLLARAAAAGFLVNSFFIDTIHWRHFAIILALLLRNYLRETDRRLVIATVGDYPHVGGKSSHIAALLAGFSKEGIEVEVMSFNRLPAMVRFGLIRGPAFLLDHGWRGLGKLWSQLVRAVCLAVKCHPFPMVHSHDISLSAVLPLFSKPEKHLLTVHGYLAYELASDGWIKTGSVLHRAFLLLEKLAYTNADVVIAVDERIRQHINDLLGQDKAVMMINFVDTDFFCPNVSHEDIERKQHTILVPRRLVRKNGVEVPIRALQYLPANYCVKVAGDGPLLPELQALAANLGVKDRVVFLGPLAPDALLTELWQADLVSIPSVPHAGVEEATSIAAIEAMAVGKAVIASRIGGLTQLVTHGENGILVDPGEPQALARACRELIEQPQKRRRIEQAARQTALANFSRQAAIKQLLILLEGRNGSS